MRRFIVLPMTILLCVFMVTPAFAVSDSEWITPSVGFSYAVFGSNQLNIYGNINHWNLDSEQNGLWDYSETDNRVYNYPAKWNVPLTVNSAGSQWTGSIPLGESSSQLPYNHYVSDQKTYHDEYEYSQMTTRGAAVWFYSDFYLDPGFYEIDTTFYSYVYLNIYGSLHQLRATFNECGFVSNGNYNKLLVTTDSNVKGTIEIKDRSRFYVAVSCSPLIEEYPYTKQFSVMPSWDIRVNTPSFSYRTVDPVSVAALDSANTDAQNSIQQNDELEAEWVGVMNDNFNALDLSNFSWDSGIIGAFSLVSDLFMRFWASLGKYSILYVFPLTLAVVLLLIGRVSRYDGKAPSGKGDE